LKLIADNFWSHGCHCFDCLPVFTSRLWRLWGSNTLIEPA
jgi:hypothetical protein